MNYEELISVVLECNKMVNSYGILPFDIAEKCLKATELLREIVAMEITISIVNGTLRIY